MSVPIGGGWPGDTSQFAVARLISFARSRSQGVPIILTVWAAGSAFLAIDDSIRHLVGVNIPGLGFLLMTAIDLNDVQTILAIAVLISLFAVTANSILLAIDRRLHRGAAA